MSSTTNPFASVHTGRSARQRRHASAADDDGDNDNDAVNTSRDSGSHSLDHRSYRSNGSGGSAGSGRRFVPPPPPPPPKSRSSSRGGGGGSKNSNSHLYEHLPEEYQFNYQTVEPVLHFLLQVANQYEDDDNNNNYDEDDIILGGEEDQQQPPQSERREMTLQALVRAAEKDVQLHRARIKAAQKQDLNLLRQFQLHQDPDYQERQFRLQERTAFRKDLWEAAPTIAGELKAALDGNETATAQHLRGLTQAERTEVQLARWQRALELYVHCCQQQQEQQKDVSLPSSSSDLNLLDWRSLMETLMMGVSEEQDMSQVLVKAEAMCQHLVEETKLSVNDAAASCLDVESSYAIRLEAHHLYARNCLQKVDKIEEQFQTSGRAALQIGHQLEYAEGKRQRAETTSILIRRWWMLENLAEQESLAQTSMNVENEVLGLVPLSECMMDDLFTKPENSLEASKALKQLRAVVRSRGSNPILSGGNNSGSGGGGSSGGGGGNNSGNGDKASLRRFDLTARLIARCSNALEQRLLNSFAKVYQQGCGSGIYDFSSKPRPGAMDWRELRALASALLLFDSGRNLHKTYVDMVVTKRFPELFEDEDSSTMKEKTKEEAKTGGGDGKTTFDVDATRSKLSNLFHRVSDVCTAEFELVAHVFGSEGAAAGGGSSGGIADGGAAATNTTGLLDGSEEMPLVVARALLQRVISDPQHGLQARINDLLGSIDRMGDFDAGAKKLDTFVVIHEKAAGLFELLKEAAERMVPDGGSSKSGRRRHSTRQDGSNNSNSPRLIATRNAVDSLKGFLTSQELALSNTHRQGYINLELRLLHHDCCSGLDQAGCTLVKGPPPRSAGSLAESGILEEYRAPVLPLHKESLIKSQYTGILAGPLKQSVLRQPLIHATDSLARARLMFGTNKRNGETTSRVILAIYGQMCSFYGKGFLYPIVETIKEMLSSSPPAQPPQLPFNEDAEAPDLGVPPAFWVSLERVHSAAKSFDRELWAENRAGSQRVWETLEQCGDSAAMATARDGRVLFYSELERRGDAAILTALDTLSTHIQWVLVTGGESMLATGGTRIFNALTGQSGGPYSIPAGSSLETPNSPAVKSLTYCLRVQFVHVQAALTSASLASFWTALSMRLYDILVARLLQHYQISTVGAVILSRDVEALRSVAMLAGTDHSHWDTLRELLTLYMTPPDAIKTMLVGPEGESSKGLFAKAGREQCLVFLSRRNDYRYKTAAGPKKSGWVTEMLTSLSLTDPSDGVVNIGLFAAGRNK